MSVTKFFLCLAVPVIAAGATVPAWDPYDEAASEWRDLAKQLTLGRDRQPKPDEVVHPAARVLPDDRDPLDVLLRRTQALVDDLKTDASALAALRADAARTAGETARFALFVKGIRLRRAVALENPLVRRIVTIAFTTHEAPAPNLVDWGASLSEQYRGYFGNRQLSAFENGTYALDDPFSDKARLRPISEMRRPEGASLTVDVSPDGTEFVYDWTSDGEKWGQHLERNTYQIYRCGVNGGNRRQLTRGTTSRYFPRFAPDGSVSWTEERDLPDTRRVRAPYFMYRRGVPGRDFDVAAAVPVHGIAYGAVVFVGKDGAFRYVTPDQLAPEAAFQEPVSFHSGAYSTPYPLSDKYFLAVYDGKANAQYGVVDTSRRKYAIVLLDVFGNRVRIFRHPRISCLSPVPVLRK